MTTKAVCCQLGMEAIPPISLIGVAYPLLPAEHITAQDLVMLRGLTTYSAYGHRMGNELRNHVCLYPERLVRSATKDIRAK